MTTDRATRACIFCNGRLRGPTRAKQIVSHCDLLIAADGGARHFEDVGLTPHVIIGDMDSIDAKKWKRHSDIEHIQKACVCVSEGVLLVYIENQDTSYQMRLPDKAQRTLS